MCSARQASFSSTVGLRQAPQKMLLGSHCPAKTQHRAIPLPQAKNNTLELNDCESASKQIDVSNSGNPKSAPSSPSFSQVEWEESDFDAIFAGALKESRASRQPEMLSVPLATIPVQNLHPG